jgi:hypothetical protein
MQIGWTYTENRILGLYGIARENGRKKEHCEKMDKDNTDKNSTDSRRAYQVALASVPRTSPKQRSTDPPPPFTPCPRHASTLLAPRPTLPGPQRSTHTRPLLGPRAAGGPFSVQQLCESHIAHTPAVIPGPLCLSIRCHSTHRPTPRSVAGLIPPL